MRMLEIDLHERIKFVAAAPTKDLSFDVIQGRQEQPAGLNGHVNQACELGRFRRQ